MAVATSGSGVTPGFVRFGGCCYLAINYLGQFGELALSLWLIFKADKIALRSNP
ncbi:hypothetical protein [Arsukibacterium sp. UBA3155]|uniref:hypothetical protein n=1 Tax=Arsukibacterium sp. UBA3155 TaxID=1946058 RepID=UPI0025C30432|nr:hypothetical protein [Arsukibacterium sp. UBA3155]